MTSPNSLIQLVTEEDLEILPTDIKNSLKSHESVNNKRFFYSVDVQSSDNVSKSESTNDTIEKTSSNAQYKMGVSNMNNDSFNTLFNELKTDMREREQRTREEIAQREDRFEKQLNSFAQEASKREERVIALVEGIKQDISQSEQRINSTVEKSENRIDENLKTMKEDFSNIKTDISNQVERLNAMERQNFWGFFAVAATILIGMLSIVITLITQLP